MYQHITTNKIMNRAIMARCSKWKLTYYNHGQLQLKAANRIKVDPT